jgi:hypothetical protein
VLLGVNVTVTRHVAAGGGGVGGSDGGGVTGVPGASEPAQSFVWEKSAVLPPVNAIPKEIVDVPLLVTLMVWELAVPTPIVGKVRNAGLKVTAYPIETATFTAAVVAARSVLLASKAPIKNGRRNLLCIKRGSFSQVRRHQADGGAKALVGLYGVTVDPVLCQ